MKIQNFIGTFVDPNNDQWIDNIDPATGNVISQIPSSQAEDVNLAVEKALFAFSSWRSKSMLERADVLDAIANKIEERLEEFAMAESLDTGKPLSLARTVDIPRAIANFRFFAGAVRHDETGCHMMAQAINYTCRKPIGVVGLITPWNLPLYLLSWKTAPALVMGNTIVAKPSEMTPTTATMLAQVIDEVSHVQDIFHVVHGYGAEAGAAIVEHPQVKAISFTGGTATGRQVAATASSHFKKLSLELGGKNSSIVFADCDFEKTVSGVARAAFLNQGQVCLCGSRILVERSIYVRFINALIEEVSSLTVGDPRNPSTKLGSLISLQHREKVERYINIARGAGGKILCGGDRPSIGQGFEQGAWLSPTLIADLDVNSIPSVEEIFGPVAVVHPFDDEEEAVRIANGVEYGLSGSVWTQDITRAHSVAQRLETGMVWVNTWLCRDLRVPFGGVKASGVGREGGRYSLEFFSDTQNICIHLG
ncbi:MAG: 2-hydroxymuconic semialdehyde dehydrogenase [Deltaproteobacteria bacterium]|nr:2-hydroxymuconic semialdehyde dehydrogenase [Deltaproteobacteria bacterium]